MTLIEISGKEYQVRNYSERTKKSQYSNRTLSEITFEVDIGGVSENEHFLDLISLSHEIQIKRIPEDNEYKTMMKESNSYSYSGNAQTEFTDYHHIVILAEIDPDKPKVESPGATIGKYIGGLGSLVVENIILALTIKKILINNQLTTEDEFDKIYDEIDEEKRKQIAESILEGMKDELDNEDESEKAD